jgi:pyrimidine operon attenuation protein / uracil phosphoribosyltransferase
MAQPARHVERKELMNAAGLAAAIQRLAKAVAHDAPLADCVLVGVQTRGVPLARRLRAALERQFGVEVPVGALDITLYRDDLTTIASHPVIHGTDIPVSIDGKRVVLVDDVLYTGRTVRAALDELIDFGRPSRIELLVLVDRGHRELPIRADFAGLVLKTDRDESVQVHIVEDDGEDRVTLLGPAAAAKPAPGPARKAKRRAR